MVRIATGTIASQAIVIGATPLLTRLYEPEDFGALAVFTALYAIVVGVFTLKYDLSIILPREDDKARDLTALTVLVSLAFSLSLLMLLAAGRVLLGFPSNWTLLLLPLAAVVGAAYTCAQQWSARASDYHRFARSQVLNSIVNVGTGLLLAVVAAELFGSLVIAFVAGLVGALTYLSLGFALGDRRGDVRTRIRGLVDAALEYKRFPQFVLPSMLMATLGLSAQPFVLQAMFSLREVGYYAIASRLLMVPSVLVGGAVAEAFRAEFVDRHRRGIEVTSFFRHTLRKLALFALPVFVAIFLVAPPLFSLLFGANYHDSGVLSRYLCIGILAQFVAQPFHYVFVATGYVRLGLLAQTAVSAVPLIGLVAGGLSGRMEHALLLWSMLTFGLAALLIWLAYRCSKDSDRAATGGAGHV